MSSFSTLTVCKSDEERPSLFGHVNAINVNFPLGGQKGGGGEGFTEQENNLFL